MGISFTDDVGNNITMTFEEHDEYMRPAALMWEENCWAQRIGSGLFFEQFIRENLNFYQTDDIIMFVVDPNFHFEVGHQYYRADGKIVTVINKNGDCFQCDDGEEAVELMKLRYANMSYDSEFPLIASELGWRYDRNDSRGDLGRCTGSQWNNPRNLIPINILEKA